MENSSKKKPTIAFIGTKGMNFGQDTFGGFETVVTELAPRLVANGYKITIYCRKNMYTVRTYPDEIEGVRLRFVGSAETKNLGTLTNSFISIINAIHEHTETVILFNLGLGIFVPLLKLFGIQVITHLDGVEWERSKWGWLAKWMFRFGAYFNTKFTDILIADAEEIRRIYLLEYHRDSVMIPYGAEIRSDLNTEYIENVNLTPDGYYLLVTRFVPENNPLFIIRNYLQSNSQKLLVVLGRNYYSSSYENEIRRIKDERIKFMGQIADRKHLYEFYRYSFGYIHGHSVGGTNPSMLEALANSSCVLALNTPFNREMLSNGKFGLFFDLESTDFIGKINYLDTHPEVVQYYKNRSIDRIKYYYNWDSVTESYLNLFDSIRA